MPKTVFFNGRKYNQSGKYFKATSWRKYGKSLLHRDVWTFYNGAIPKGFHIHHKDKNKANNDISNLELKKVGDHASEHSLENWQNKEFRTKMQGHLETINELAKEWHTSEEGTKWHSEHGKEGWKTRQGFKKNCEECGEEYTTYFPNRSRFCHQNCKAKALRKRRRLQSDH
jgi:hypothetical protein